MADPWDGMDDVSETHVLSMDVLNLEERLGTVEGRLSALEERVHDLVQKLAALILEADERRTDERPDRSTGGDG